LTPKDKIFFLKLPFLNDFRDQLENLATLDLKVYLAFKDNLDQLDPQVHLDLLVKLLQPHRL
jgi:hypothetical protein